MHTGQVRAEGAPNVAEGSWNGVTKTLHWLLALSLLAEVPAGFLMSYTYGPSFKDAQVLKLHVLCSQIHHTAGLLILLAALLWILWRSRTARPALPPLMPAWQKVAAKAVQAGLITLLVALPWSGWTALSALEDSKAYGATHIWFFGSDGLIPRIWKPLPFNDPQGYALFGKLHVGLLRIGLALLMLHVGSALWHQFVTRDEVLARMWPLGRPRGG
jgi:cytochrome b561